MTGEGRTDAEVNQGLNILSSFFETRNIFFNIIPQYDYINSTYFNSNFNDIKSNELTSTNVNNNAINIYILGIDTWNQGRATGIISRSCVIGGKVLGADLLLI